MAAHNVNTLIYSSTCATYGEPDTMPIVETTPQVGPLMHELLFSKCYWIESEIEF
jgi:UDP-glucose 4-epimerase